MLIWTDEGQLVNGQGPGVGEVVVLRVAAAGAVQLHLFSCGHGLVGACVSRRGVGGQDVEGLIGAAFTDDRQERYLMPFGLFRCISVLRKGPRVAITFSERRASRRRSISRHDGKAKPYPVTQVGNVILRYSFGDRGNA